MPLNNPLHQLKAKTKILQLRRLRRAISNLSAQEIAGLFHLPLDKRASALHRLDMAIAEQQALLKRLKTAPARPLPKPSNDAWQRDIEQWRAQGGNCD